MDSNHQLPNLYHAECVSTLCIRVLDSNQFAPDLYQWDTTPEPIICSKFLLDAAPSHTELRIRFPVCHRIYGASILSNQLILLRAPLLGIIYTESNGVSRPTLSTFMNEFISVQHNAGILLFGIEPT